MVSTQSPNQIYHFCYLFFNKNDIFNFWRWSSYYERYSLSRTSNFSKKRKKILKELFFRFSTSISPLSLCRVYSLTFNFNLNVRVHSIASYERHCSNKHPLALKGLRNRYLHISMLLLTRARVILGQVRNRSKHNSPIKKKKKKRTHLHTDLIFPNGDRRFPAMIDAAYVDRDSRKAVYYFLFQETRSVMKAR